MVTKLAYTILLFSIVFSPLAALQSYRKVINGSPLRATAPTITKQGGYTNFNSIHKTRRQVTLLHGETTIYARSAALQESTDKVFLTGFYSEYMGHDIWGERAVYNPRNNFFDASSVFVKSNKVVASVENFSFYGNHISLKKASFGIDVLKLDIDFDQIDLYPGWVVARNTYPKLFGYPVFYIPTVVDDKRRNSFTINEPLPQAGSSFFRGEYFQLNVHYYLAGPFYGNVFYGRSQLKGEGYGLQQIVRFSDVDHLFYQTQNWQHSNTQEIVSYEHSFIEMPNIYKLPGKGFDRLLRFNEQVSELPANRLRITVAKYEELSEDIIHKEPEIFYQGRFSLPWYNLQLRSNVVVANINELTTDTQAEKQSFKSELERECSLRWLGKFTPGLGYDTVKYNINPYSWHRMYGYAYASRSWWLFSASAKVTDYVDERGGSPFNHDRKDLLSDNLQTGVKMKLGALELNRDVKTALYTGSVFDVVHVVSYRTSSWFLEFKHSLRDEGWSTGFGVSLI